MGWDENSTYILLSEGNGPADLISIGGNKMLDKEGFNLWTESYDEDVELSEETGTYPFAGYSHVLGRVYSLLHACVKPGGNILDIGFGTGTLTKQLYDEGFTIFGMDFSDKMVEKAKAKMPGAVLLQHDFAEGLPEALSGVSFDCILSTYAIHHLSDTQKVTFIRDLLERLSETGKLLIGDVAFSTVKDLERCRASNREGWDEEEFYPVLERLRPYFSAIEFEKISFCSGVFLFSKESKE